MRLKTFGGLRLEGSSLRMYKVLLVLCYLRLEGVRERRHLAELFWPGYDNGLRNLSKTLHRLRKAAPGVLETDNIFASTHLSTDFSDLGRAFENRNWETVLQTYQGPFLDGVKVQDTSVELVAWLYAKRESFAACVRRALLHEAAAKVATGNYTEAAVSAAAAYQLRHAPEMGPEDLKRTYLLRAGNHAG